MARKGPLPPLLLINPASTVTVRRDGQWQTIGPLKALVADVGDLNIVHRTVFSRPKESVNAPQVSLCAHQTEGQTNPTVCDRRVLREEGTQRRVGRQRRYTDHIVSSRRMGTDASSNVGGVISAKRGTCSQGYQARATDTADHPAADAGAGGVAESDTLANSPNCFLDRGAQPPPDLLPRLHCNPFQTWGLANLRLIRFRSSINSTNSAQSQHTTTVITIHEIASFQFVG